MSSWRARSSSSLWHTCTFRMYRSAPRNLAKLMHTRETKRKTLEEVAAAFGDRVVLADEAPKRASVAGDADHVESAVPKEP